jgi:hypothetical protein
MTAVIRRTSQDRSGAVIRWAESGEKVEILGPEVVIDGTFWTPVVFIAERYPRKPDWVLTSALEPAK